VKADGGKLTGNMGSGEEGGMREQREGRRREMGGRVGGEGEKRCGGSERGQKV